MVEQGHLPEKDIIALATGIDRSRSGHVQKFSDDHQLDYTNADQLSSFKPDEWISEHDPVLTSFVKGVGGLSTDESSSTKKKTYAFAKSLDQLCYVKNLNYISPISFSENLLSYNIAGSKSASAIIGASSPAGSYNTMRKWLDSQSNNSGYTPNSDVVVVFDNNQLSNIE